MSIPWNPQYEEHYAALLAQAPLERDDDQTEIENQELCERNAERAV